jgi:hypothetical protein
MKITINFGLSGHKKTIDWYRDIHDFPKNIQFENKKWEWVFYAKDGNGDYTLTFGELSQHDPQFYEDMAIFEDMFKNYSDGCVCGAAYSPFKWDHLRYCKLWKPWEQI